MVGIGAAGLVVRRCGAGAHRSRLYRSTGSNTATLAIDCPERNRIRRAVGQSCYCDRAIRR